MQTRIPQGRPMPQRQAANRGQRQEVAMQDGSRRSVPAKAPAAPARMRRPAPMPMKPRQGR